MEKQLEQNVKPLYGIIAASGNEWTVEYAVQPRKDGSGIVTHSLTGYGEFPRERFPDIPVINYTTATSAQIMNSLGLSSLQRAREENPSYSGTLEGFLTLIRGFGIEVL